MGKTKVPLGSVLVVRFSMSFGVGKMHRPRTAAGLARVLSKPLPEGWYYRIEGNLESLVKLGGVPTSTSPGYVPSRFTGVRVTVPDVGVWTADVWL